jgi:hypothetical protein
MGTELAIIITTLARPAAATASSAERFGQR